MGTTVWVTVDTIHLCSSIYGGASFKYIICKVVVTLAINCRGEMRPIHLSGLVLKLDIDEVRANHSYSCETIP
eukprot:scaffold137978_cov76-Cyclotella_meneghiniana.AAC.1